MTIELQMLAWSVLLGLFQVMLAITFVTAQRGVRWNISARDQVMPPVTGVAGRLDRAAENFKETFPFFLAAVLMVQVLGRNSATTALGAQLYLAGRVLYIPLYAFGITHVRTAVWMLATLGIVLVLGGAFV